jgi:hypothetical protein
MTRTAILEAQRASVGGEGNLTCVRIWGKLFGWALADCVGTKQGDRAFLPRPHVFYIRGNSHVEWCVCVWGGGLEVLAQVEAKIAHRMDKLLNSTDFTNERYDASLAELWVRSGLRLLYDSTRVFRIDADFDSSAGAFGTARARPSVVEAIMRGDRAPPSEVAPAAPAADAAPAAGQEFESESEY